VTLGNTAAGNGTINLNGGSLQARRLLGGPGAGTVNFNGGVLRVGPNPNVDFITGLTAANVLAGGAVIDTGTNSVGITQALVDGGGNGGLIKQGTGALYLNGVNTYTGTTVVSQGTLGGTGTIAGPVSIAVSAAFAPGIAIGTLTINNTLGLAGTSTTVMEVNKTANTNDLVTGVATLTYGGTLVLKNHGGLLAVNDTFNLFDATTFTGSFSSVVSQTPGQTVTWDTSNLLVDGSVRVASAVAASVTLTSVASGNTLDLSWPADQLGWRLEVQTNSLTVGINNDWFTVPGSTEVTEMSVPVVPGNPTVFYRLVFP
jgi:autotransporter-associated beta strand protein